MSVDNRIFFLSGLPRTGSTLLGSILNQNPDIHVSPTSPLYPLLVETNECFNRLDVQYTFDKEMVSKRVYKEMIQAFYPDKRKQPIIFDKHRGWPKHIAAIREYIGEPKIVCTIRPIIEIITSYLTLANNDKDNFIDRHLSELGQEITDEARAFLLWTDYLGPVYETLCVGLNTEPDSILLIEYEDIVYQPEKTLGKIYSFCSLSPFKHTFDNIENTCEESKDEAWGLKNLHTIRPELKRKSENPLIYLPPVAIEYFSQFDIKVSI